MKEYPTTMIKDIYLGLRNILNVLTRGSFVSAVTGKLLVYVVDSVSSVTSLGNIINIGGLSAYSTTSDINRVNWNTNVRSRIT